MDDNQVEDNAGMRQREVTRRLFLAWVGVGTAVAAGGIAAYAKWGHDDEPAREAGAESGPTFENRLLSFSLAPQLLHAAKDLTFATPFGDYPLTPHTNSTRSQFLDQNAVAHRIDPTRLTHFVGDPQDPAKVSQVRISGALPTMAAVWGKDKFGRDQIWGTAFYTPTAAMGAVTQEALKVKTLAKLFRNDLRLTSLGATKGSTPRTLEEAMALPDITEVYLASAATLIFGTPAITMADPQAATIIKNIIYSQGGLTDVANAIKTFNEQLGAPYGEIEEGAKGVDGDGNLIPETLDPRIGDPNFKWDTAKFGPEPVVPPEVGSQVFRYINCFIEEGATFGPRNQVIPSEYIVNFRESFRAAQVSTTNAIQDTPSLIAEITPDSTTEDIGGKSGFVFPELPPPTLVAGETQKSTSVTPTRLRGAGGVVLDGVTFELTNTLHSQGGLTAELTKVEVGDGHTTKFTVRVKNDYLRQVIFGLQWFDGAGLPMQPPDEQCFADTITGDWTYNTISDAMLSSAPTVMGIPLVGVPASVDLVFFLPLNGDKTGSKSAVRGRIIAGTAGTMDNWRDLFSSYVVDQNGAPVLKNNDIQPVFPYSDAVMKNTSKVFTAPQWFSDAVSATIVVNIGLPSLMLLAAGVLAGINQKMINNVRNEGKTLKELKAMEEYKNFVANDPLIAAAETEALEAVCISNVRKDINYARGTFHGFFIMQTLLDVLQSVLDESLYHSWKMPNPWSMVDRFAKLILNFMKWSIFVPSLKAYLEGLATSKATSCVPIIGQIFMAVSIASDTAQLTTASINVTTSSGIAHWEIQGKYTMTLTASPFQFKTFSPAAATWYVEVIYQGQRTLNEWEQLEQGKTQEQIVADWGRYGAAPQNPFITPKGFKYDVTGGVLTVARTDDFPPGARSAPITVPIEIDFGCPYMLRFTILDEDAFAVGIGATDWIQTNTQIDKIQTTIALPITEEGVNQSGETYYQVQGTTTVIGESYSWADKAAPGTIHRSSEVQPGSIVVGRGTGLLSYVFQDDGRWYIRQISMDGSNPGAGASELPTVWNGHRPWLAVDPMAQLGAAGIGNWLLEPIADDSDGAGGYHLRSLNLDPKQFNFDSKKSYGRYLAPLSHLTLGASGHLIGVHTDTGKLSVLLPSSRAYDPQEGQAPFPQYFAGPGNANGDRPGLLNRPVAVSISGNGVIAVLEQGSQRMQAFNLYGNPVKAFINGVGSAVDQAKDGMFYASFGKQDPVQFLDMSTDGKGFIFVLGYIGDGTKETDYFLDAFAPGSEQRLYRMNGFNAYKLAMDPFRNSYTLNFTEMGAPGGAAKSQPTASIWIPRTPHHISSTN